MFHDYFLLSLHHFSRARRPTSDYFRPSPLYVTLVMFALIIIFAFSVFGVVFPLHDTCTYV
jgi:hypothetical protein